MDTTSTSGAVPSTLGRSWSNESLDTKDVCAEVPGERVPVTGRESRAPTTGIYICICIYIYIFRWNDLGSPYKCPKISG